MIPRREFKDSIFAAGIFCKNLHEFTEWLGPPQSAYTYRLFYNSLSKITITRQGYIGLTKALQHVQNMVLTMLHNLYLILLKHESKAAYSQNNNINKGGLFDVRIHGSLLQNNGSGCLNSALWIFLYSEVSSHSTTEQYILMHCHKSPTPSTHLHTHIHSINRLLEFAVIRICVIPAIRKI